MNKVLLKGNLTKDVDVRQFDNGTVLATFTVATNKRWKDSNGDVQEEATFHSCVAFGKLAEIIANNLGKGDSILVEGELRNREWETENGEKRYKTEVVVKEFEFCGSKK